MLVLPHTGPRSHMCTGVRAKPFSTAPCSQPESPREEHKSFAALFNQIWVFLRQRGCLCLEQLLINSLLQTHPTALQAHERTEQPISCSKDPLLGTGSHSHFREGGAVTTFQHSYSEVHTVIYPLPRGMSQASLPQK